MPRPTTTGPTAPSPGVRARVDLVAPGDAFLIPVTGGTFDSPYEAGIGPNLYDGVGAATSLSTPLVSGGVALLKDVARDRFAGNDAALDTRVMKAILMNSADKLAGWNNEQSLANGVLATSQALDYTQGAGRLNLSRAFDGFTTGTTDLPGLSGGKVQRIGWDFGSVADGGFNDYGLGALAAGDDLTATLVWFADVSTTGTNDGLGVSPDAFTNLNLQILRDGILVAESNAAYTTTQHLSFTLTGAGDYTLRVLWAGDRYDFVNKKTTPYGFAWNAQPVPEPAAFLPLGLCALGLLRRRARR